MRGKDAIALPDSPPPTQGPGEAGQEEMMGDGGRKGRDSIQRFPQYSQVILKEVQARLGEERVDLDQGMSCLPCVVHLYHSCHREHLIT